MTPETRLRLQHIFNRALDENFLFPYQDSEGNRGVKIHTERVIVSVVHNDHRKESCNLT